MKTVERFFCGSVVAVLLLTAAAKFWSAGGRAPILEYPDPLFGLSNRWILWSVGAVEVALALTAVSGLKPRIRYLGLCWLGVNFLLYRLGSLWLSPDKPCPCLGTVTEKLGLTAGQANGLLWLLVLYILLGSLWFLNRSQEKVQLGP